MLPSANNLLQSLRDGIRGVRYSIRAEAEHPGSALPEKLRGKLGPLLTMSSAVGTPAFRLADGIFSQVESIAADVLIPVSRQALLFPCTVDDLFAGPDDRASFSDRLYGPVKLLLTRHGVRNMLVSESALDAAWSQVRQRHHDAVKLDVDPRARSAEQDRALVQVCAGIACAIVDAKPIRKLEFEDVGKTKPHFMLSPNLYCGMTFGLAIAVVTLDPGLADDGEAVIDSIDSVIDARFDRFKGATMSKAPILELANEFQMILPYLP